MSGRQARGRGAVVVVIGLLLLGLAHCGSDPKATVASDGGGPDGGRELADAGSCAAPRTACGETCVDLETNNAHCGACSTACSRAERCSQGRCVGACPAGQTDCGAACVNVGTDEANCGSCGAACEAGQVCSHGACSAVCASDLLTCQGHCADPAIDPQHCGDCDTACPGLPNALPACASGTCATACIAGFGDCNGIPADGCETNTLLDAHHCGACTTSCFQPNVTDAVCLLGTCALTHCAAKWGDCNGVLSDGCEHPVDHDMANCGACGNVCGLGANVTASSCWSGSCAQTCAVGFGDCNRDPSDGCEYDVSSDPANCGGCGSRCSAGQICVQRHCACTGGLSICGGVCKDLSNDVDNCGACVNHCALANSSSPSCVGGACEHGPCEATWDDCDGIESNGCEAHLATDEVNCGVCGASCAPGETCASGVCTPAPACVAVTEPKVLIYRTLEPAILYALPYGSSLTVADESTWRSYTTQDFASYDLILLDAAFSAADLQAAFDTRGVWSPAVTGRIVIDGMVRADGYAGVSAIDKRAFVWITSGLGTGLFLGSDKGARGLDYLGAFGTFASTPASGRRQISLPSHPILAGETDASLQAISLDDSIRMQVPVGFESLVRLPNAFNPVTANATLVARDAACSQ